MHNYAAEVTLSLLSDLQEGKHTNRRWKVLKNYQVRCASDILAAKHFYFDPLSFDENESFSVSDRFLDGQLPFPAITVSMPNNYDGPGASSKKLLVYTEKVNVLNYVASLRKVGCVPGTYVDEASDYISSSAQGIAVRLFADDSKKRWFVFTGDAVIFPKRFLKGGGNGYEMLILSPDANKMQCLMAGTTESKETVNHISRKLITAVRVTSMAVTRISNTQWAPEDQKIIKRQLQDNLARLGKKQLPIFEVTEVHVGGKPNTSSAEWRGGTHASPRQHDRRGHERTYKKSGKTIWVSACKVGSIKNGIISNSYIVEP